MQQFELGLQGEDSHRAIERRSVQELQQLIAGVNLLRRVAISGIKQDHVQAVGLESWRVCHYRRWKLNLRCTRETCTRMLKIETADLLRLAVLKHGKVRGFKVGYRLSLDISGNNIK